MLYEFKLGHNAGEAAKIIYCAKDEDAVEHSTATKWFKKFRSGFKNLDVQTMSGWSKTMDPEVVLQDIEVNLENNIWRVSGDT